MEKIIQIHLQVHVFRQPKPRSAEKGNRRLLGQYYPIHTVIDKLFDFSSS